MNIHRIAAAVSLVLCAGAGAQVVRVPEPQEAPSAPPQAPAPFPGVSIYAFHDPSGGPAETHVQLLADYDFQVVKVFGGFDSERHLFDADVNATATTDGASAKAYMVGLTAPAGNGTFRLSYQWRTQSDDRNLDVPAIGCEYYLLKNLRLYASCTRSASAARWPRSIRGCR